MFSQEYYHRVEDVRQFHLQNKTYSGGGTLAYAEELERTDQDWWKEQFKDWQGSELVLKFIE